jgi:hypothetical protein
MSDVTLPRTMLRKAEPLGGHPRSQSLVRAKPLTEPSPNLSGLSESPILPRTVLEPIVICIDTTRPVAALPPFWSGLWSGTGAVACLMHLIAQEAPAWGTSMVVHMVTLVTMALVTVPNPVLYKTQHLLVTPPEEEKVEEIKQVENEQPTTLEENQMMAAATFESKIERDSMDIQPSDELQASLSAVDLSDYGLEHIPKGDLLTTVGAYGSMGLSARNAAAKAKLLLREGGNDTSEKAVATALRWLAGHQLHDGSWSFNHSLSPTCRDKCRNPGKKAEARNAATGLALLPFLGSGQTHLEGQYRMNIKRGLTYLVDHMHVGSYGGSFIGGADDMYSQGIASIALCEAYGMTNDEELKVPAQKALDFICYAQNEKGGGWRYKPHQPGDTSMLGWQLMALKSGHMSNLVVSPLTIHRASLFLDSVQSDDGATYGYQNRQTGEATTAIGALCRMYLGLKKDNLDLQHSVEYLGRHGPSGANMYYNYYATQVMRHWEGEEWINWNNQMRDQLVHAQAKQGHEDGSWYTGAGDLGTDPGGRLYCTAMATMILEVYYRHLPLYRSQSVDQDFPE